MVHEGGSRGGGGQAVKPEESGKGGKGKEGTDWMANRGSRYSLAKGDEDPLLHTSTVQHGEDMDVDDVEVSELWGGPACSWRPTPHYMHHDAVAFPGSVSSPLMCVYLSNVFAQSEEWPPVVTDKLATISATYTPVNPENRRAHEASLAQVFSDGTNPDVLEVGWSRD